MKRPSWGFGIALLYSVFALSIMGLVWKSFGQKIELVESDYYEREIEYNARMEKMNRAKLLDSQLSWRIASDTLYLQFPASVDKGTLRFMRPSDASADIVVAARPSDETTEISLSGFHRGAYRLKADWTMAGEDYYSEHIVVIP